jgi:3-oxoacyl-[acyl-carrier-protein] synthase III
LRVPVYVTGVGAALPERVLTNAELAANMPWLDVSAEWIAEHTGIEQRHVARPSEHATDLGVRAAIAALAHAQCTPDDIDLVLLATNSAQFVYPAGAALIQELLCTASARRSRMARAAALDLQQGCASMVAAVILAAGMVQNGSCQRVLVVGAEVATRMVDWTDRNAVLLGDGAAACVVAAELPASPSRAPALEILASFMRTIPDRDSIFQLGVLEARNDPFQHIEFAQRLAGPVGKEQIQTRLLAADPAELRSRYFHMDGTKVYRFVRRVVAASGYLEVLARAGFVTADERQRIEEHLRTEAASLGELGDELLARLAGRVDRLVAHGANMTLNQELADQMRIPYDRMAVALQDTGNTSAASVGIALGRLLRGPVRYSTTTKRDPSGAVTKPKRDVVVEPLCRGHTALLLSFGAGTSWNYVATRVV